MDPLGEVKDLERISYLHQHLEAAARAIKAGVNLAGYYVWSLLDNFEWGWGYQKRFGIVFVDFETQRRHPQGQRAVLLRGRARERGAVSLGHGTALSDDGQGHCARLAPKTWPSCKALSARAYRGRPRGRTWPTAQARTNFMDRHLAHRRSLKPSWRGKRSAFAEPGHEAGG